MTNREQYFKSMIVTMLLVASILLLTACGGGSSQPSSSSSGSSGGGGSSQSKGPFTIGVSNGFVGSEWRTQMIQDMQTANAEYVKAGLTKDLIVQSADVDVPGQIQQMRNLISRGVNAIIVDPNSITGLNSVMSEAKKAGIVVISVDQAVPSPAAINVVIDQTEWARMSMRWLADQLHGKGNIVIINGIAGNPANEARYNGVKDVLTKYPNIKVLNVVNANWDEATGQQKMADLLASQPNIDGVWTQDGMAQGALQAVAAANPAKWPIMVGEGRAGYLQLWQQVKQKRPNFGAYGVVNPPGAGASGLRIAVQLLQGKKLKDDALKGDSHNTIFVPIPGTVNPDNYNDQYNLVKDKPASYTLDGSISDADAKNFFS